MTNALLSPGLHVALGAHALADAVAEANGLPALYWAQEKGT
jgi:hypothetical protein